MCCRRRRRRPSTVWTRLSGPTSGKAALPAALSFASRPPAAELASRAPAAELLSPPVGENAELKPLLQAGWPCPETRRLPRDCSTVPRGETQAVYPATLSAPAVRIPPKKRSISFVIGDCKCRRLLKNVWPRRPCGCWPRLCRVVFTLRSLAPKRV